MKIENIQTIEGPNVFHSKPVLVMYLSLEELTEKASTDIEGFNDKLLEVIPTLKHHKCSPGYEGGFIERLNRGTYFAHITEHVALELSELTGIGVDYGKSIYNGAPGKYKVAVRFRNKEVMKYLLNAAVKIIEMVCSDKHFDTAKFFVNSTIIEAKRILAKTALGPSTEAILKAVKKKNIPWQRVNDESLIQLGYGKKRKFIQATTTSDTGDIAVDMAQDKYLTKKLLANALIKVPTGRPVGSVEEAKVFFNKFGPPVAIKPMDGNHGRGITLNITNEKEILPAFNLALAESNQVLIEECLIGNDYRIFLVGAKMVAAAHRIPANVKGDGISTVQELINLENENPLRGEGHEKSLTKIHYNAETELVLKRQHLGLNDIPEKDMIVYLKETANISTGGCAVDVTDEVHPEIKFMCERAAKIINLDVCGLDFIAEDITKPLLKQKAGIIEINAGPGLRMHQSPSYGKPRDVGAAIVDYMFEDDGRIPIVAITGTNGKTTVARLLGHILTSGSIRTGVTTSDGIYIDKYLIDEGDTTGPISAKVILSDPTIEAAVLETARGGIVKRGLAFDYCDVGIFTNVNIDHIGQDGIETIEDIVKIKSLVIEQVRPGGTVILNADSEDVTKIVSSKRVDIKNKKLVYFSMDGENPVFTEHIRNGGHGYFFKDHHIIEVLGDIESVVVSVDDIPLTMRGTAKFHVMNAMAAIAAAHAMKVDDAVILKALADFNQDQNPGRTNLYRVKNGYVMMDYGHNPDALKSISDMARKWNISKLTGVLTAPGDRADELISMIGTSAAFAFDKIIIREDEDLRGRKQGEIAQLIKDSALSQNENLDCQVILDSRSALKIAIGDMEENELVVYFYDDLELAEDFMKEYRVDKDVPSKLFIKDENDLSQQPMH